MAKKSSDPRIAITAGCIAGGIETISIWPMEYIKTQLQLQGKLPAGEKPKFTGMVSGFQYVIRTNGFLGLYKGLTPTLVASIPKAGIRFGLNSYIKGLLMDKNGKLSPAKGFLAGLIAGSTEAAIVTAPAETVKTKLIQANMGMISGIKHIVATEGIGGMYQGVAATIMKQGSNHGLRFMFFGQYKQYILGDETRGLTALESLFGGMSAGCFSVLGNNPFDVVKTRMQGIDAAKYKSTMDCFSKIASQEGFTSFYAGTLPRLGRVVPGQGIIFMSFETIQSMVEKWMKK
mmetsp:Transcript_38661/g.50941  ORF Transcript_38661/g.50941 Transcript_38661/m.50941 type:complete len:289 (+) Transcript_38661:127-993(+)